MKKNYILILVLLLLLPMVLAGQSTIYSYQPDDTNRITTNVNQDNLTINLDGAEVVTIQIGINLLNGTYYTLQQAKTILGFNYTIPITSKAFGESYNISITGLTTPHNITNVTQNRVSGTNNVIMSNSKISYDDKIKLDFTPIYKDNQTYQTRAGQVMIGGFDNTQTFILIDPDATLGDSANLGDTLIDETNPGDNFGSDEEFRIDSGAGIDGQISLLRWNISEAGMPLNATNIQVILNLTSGSSNTVLTNFYDATNTSWDEDVVTWNNFFCTINSTGQVVADASCSIITTLVTLSDTDGVINQINLTGWINQTDTFKTVVIAAATNEIDQWKGSTKEDTTTSDRPSLKITWDEGTPPPPPPSGPIINLTPIGSLDLIGCLSGELTDMVIHDTKDIAFAYGEASGNATIAVINFADPTTPVLLSCNDITDLGGLGSRELSYIDAPFTAVIDGALFINGQDGSARVNVTGGSNLDFDFEFLSAANDVFIIERGSTFSTDDFGAALDTITGEFFTIDLLNGTVLNVEDFSAFSVFLNRISKPFTSGGNIYHAIATLTGRALVRNTDTLVYTDLIVGNTGGGDDLDIFGTSIAIADGRFLTLYEFASDTMTLQDTFTNPTDNKFMGVQYLSDDFLITASLEQISSNITLTLYNISDPTNIQNLSGLLTGLKAISTGAGSIEFRYPHIFLGSGDDPATQARFTVFQVTIDEFELGNNKRPEITTLETVSGQLGLETNTTTLINSVVQNPETSQIGENKLFTLTCEYVETTLEEETFDDGFDFNASCGSSFPIGTIAGVNFGLGLDLSTCNNDILSIPTSVDSNLIVSFDIYTPKLESGTAEIEFIDFSGTTFESISLTHSQGLLNLTADGTIILSIDTNDLSSTIPTRLFFQINPGSTDPNLDNEMYFSTNYFLLKKEPTFSSDTSIDGTYCNFGFNPAPIVPEFCATGITNSITLPYVNYFGIRLVSGTGNISLDNYKVVSTNDYTPYTSIANDDLIQVECNFPTNGDVTVRAYSSDELYGHNYLAFKDLALVISATGFQPIGDSLVNGTIATIIEDIVSLGGFSDQQSLLLLALIAMVGAAIGMIAGGFHYLGVIFIEGVLATLFFFLGWLPLSAFIIVILLAVGLSALAFSNIFIGGGFGGGGS